MPIAADDRHRAFALATSFAAFAEDASQHAAAFQDTYAAVEFPPQEIAEIATIPGPVDVLAIVEDWCPDVVATLPVVARLAETSRNLELHVLVRGPATAHIADAYPHEGRSHIPTYVLWSAGGEELGVLVERTPEIGRVTTEFLDAFLAEHPHLDRDAFPAGLDDATRADLIRRALGLRDDVRDLERRTLVRDLVAIATSAGATPTARDAAASVAPA